MSTYAVLTVPASQSNELDRFSSAARQTLAGLEDSLSIFKPQSEISKLNRSAGTGWCQLTDHGLRVLKLSLLYAELSHGTFDPTIEPLMQLWGFRGGAQDTLRLPDDKEIKACLVCVGYTHILLNQTSAMLDRSGVSVDLGGIAKGYAVDVCYESLRNMGLTNLLVNLGGNIRCGGTPTPAAGGPWKIGVRDPFHTDGILGWVALTNGQACGTSGNYEKFVTIDGKRYTHIIDPRTGHPVQGMAGVTILATNAVEADAMSKPLFVLGIKETPAVLAAMPGCEALIVPDEQPTMIWVTPGFRRVFTPEPAYESCIRDLPTTSVGTRER